MRWALLLVLAGLWPEVQAQARALERSRAVVAAFRAGSVCPSTGRVRGACPGWQVDHVVPLCAGGLDSLGNLQWLAVADHRFKTFVDVRECRKLRRMAGAPAVGARSYGGGSLSR